MFCYSIKNKREANQRKRIWASDNTIHTKFLSKGKNYFFAMILIFLKFIKIKITSSSLTRQNFFILLYIAHGFCYNPKIALKCLIYSTNFG